MEKELCFYFVRHGRTEWNVAGKMQGRQGGELTEQGIRGAIATGNALRKVPLIAAYSSTLERAVQTARYILNERQSDHSRVPFFQHLGLNEHYFGSWEGLPIREIESLEEYRQLQHDPANYQARVSGGETYETLQERAVQAVDDIIRVHSYGNILVVSHGHTLRLLLSVLNGATWQTHRQAENVIELRNTSISVVRYVQKKGEQTGRFILEKTNDTSHLS